MENGMSNSRLNTMSVSHIHYNPHIGRQIVHKYIRDMIALSIHIIWAGNNYCTVLIPINFTDHIDFIPTSKQILPCLCAPGPWGYIFSAILVIYMSSSFFSKMLHLKLSCSLILCVFMPIFNLNFNHNLFQHVMLNRYTCPVVIKIQVHSYQF